MMQEAIHLKYLKDVNPKTERMSINVKWNKPKPNLKQTTKNTQNKTPSPPKKQTWTKPPPPSKEENLPLKPQNYQFSFLAVKSPKLEAPKGSLIGLILHLTFFRDLENKLDR